MEQNIPNIEKIKITSLLISSKYINEMSGDDKSNPEYVSAVKEMYKL